MTEEERNAINARKKDLIANGVSKEMADIIAKVFFESGLISPVLDDNYRWAANNAHRHFFKKRKD